MLRFREPLDVAAVLGAGGGRRVSEAVTDRHDESGPGVAFVAVPGVSRDGADFAADAAARGAACVVSERPLPLPVPNLVVPHAREAYGRLCHSGLGDPSRGLAVVGVTGTDGKTTTCWMLRHILNRCLGRTALCGTVETDDGRVRSAASLTTPGAADLASFLFTAVANGCVAAVVEISSHALAQRRTAGLSLDAAVVTNVRRDHLDYHGDAEAYAAAKASIAGLLRSGRATVLGAVPDGFEGRLANPVRSAFGGRVVPRTSPFLEAPHNRENALVAVAAAEEVGVDGSAAAAALSDFPGVLGRWQRIEEGQPFEVVVDYAHTPAAVRAAVRAASSAVRGGARVLVVCGAGGDRDAGKRPLIGEALGGADRVWLTSDNPRSEDPGVIAGEIAAGIPPSVSVTREVDRAAAIGSAVAAAGPGDCVLVLGKGHERTQTVGTDVRPFVDQEVCVAALKSAGHAGAGR